MAKYCTKCGNCLSDDSQFCNNCGSRCDGNIKKYRNSNANTKYVKYTKEKVSQWLPLAFVLILFFAFGMRYIWPKINTSWVVDEACKEVKSEVYEVYGEIPHLIGKIIYKNGYKYIVAVKFEVDDLEWKASHACLVCGYRKNNCYVSNMTNEMSYDYNYSQNVDKLKALWALD